MSEPIDEYSTIKEGDLQRLRWPKLPEPDSGDTKGIPPHIVLKPGDRLKELLHELIHRSNKNL